MCGMGLIVILQHLGQSAASSSSSETLLGVARLMPTHAVTGLGDSQQHLHTRCNSELTDILRTPVLTSQAQTEMNTRGRTTQKVFVLRIYLQMFSGEQSTSLVSTGCAHCAGGPHAQGQGFHDFCCRGLKLPMPTHVHANECKLICCLKKEAGLKRSVTVIKVMLLEKQLICAQKIHWSFAADCAPPQKHMWQEQPGADLH